MFFKGKIKSGIEIEGLRPGKIPLRLSQKRKNIEDTKSTKWGKLSNMGGIGDDLKVSVSKRGLEDVKSLCVKTLG